MVHHDYYVNENQTSNVIEKQKINSHKEIGSNPSVVLNQDWESALYFNDLHITPKDMTNNLTLLVNKLEEHVKTVEKKLDIDEIIIEFDNIQHSFPVLRTYLENYSTIVSFGDKSRILHIEELVTLLRLKKTTPYFLYSISIVKEVLVDFYFKETKNIFGLSVEKIYDREYLIQTLSNLELYKDLLSSSQYDELYKKLLAAVAQAPSTYEEEFVQGRIVKGTYDRDESVYHVLKVGNREVLLPKKRKLLHEKLAMEGIIYLYITEVNHDKDKERIFVSRTHPFLLRFLLKQQIPLIKSKVIEVLTVIRNNGESAKIIIDTEDPTIDPVKICEEYLPSISRELPHEKIEFVRFSPDKEEYFKNLFYPVKILLMEEEGNTVKLSVASDADDTLIGKNSSNLKLIKQLLRVEFAIEKEMSPEELESWNRLL